MKREAKVEQRKNLTPKCGETKNKKVMQDNRKTSRKMAKNYY